MNRKLKREIVFILTFAILILNTGILGLKNGVYQTFASAPSSQTPNLYKISIPKTQNISNATDAGGIIPGQYIVRIIGNNSHFEPLSNSHSSSNPLSSSIDVNNKLPVKSTSANLGQAKKERNVAISSIKNQGVFEVTHNFTSILNGTAFVIKAKPTSHGSTPTASAVSAALASLQKAAKGVTLEVDRRVIGSSLIVPLNIKRVGSMDTFANTFVSYGNPHYHGRVAVIDTGVSTTHPDLNVIGGKSFVGNNQSFNDDNGHGSNVAGIIAGKNHIMGIAPGAPIYSLKVLDATGHGNLSDVISALDWVKANATKDLIDTINLSLELPGSSDTLKSAILDVTKRGVTVVVAAGNDMDEAINYAPAMYGGKHGISGVITVTAITDTDGKCGGKGSIAWTGHDDSFAGLIFANRGPSVDIAAPGVDINSTSMNNEYKVLTGTSQASPHVAGAVLLYKTLHPSATPSEVKAGLLHMSSLPTRGNELTCNKDGNTGSYDLSTDIDTTDKIPLLNVNNMTSR